VGSSTGFLDAQASAAVVKAYGIRTPQSEVVATSKDAVRAALRLGFPVALKLVAPDVVHKSDVGGVILSLEDEQEVEEACDQLLATHPQARVMVQQMVSRGHEVILGARRDEQFGPVVMFGLGGILVEALKDVAFGLAPLDYHEAASLLADTAAGRILKGVRGQEATDVEGLIDAICRVGQLVSDVPEISELDINPLIVGPSEDGVWAVDVRVALSASNRAEP
jgi:acetyltransferase